VGSVTDTARPMLHRLFSCRLPECGDLGFSADELQDQINIPRGLLERLGGVVDRPVGAEFAIK
jgi:hypothetical protein